MHINQRKFYLSVAKIFTAKLYADHQPKVNEYCIILLYCIVRVQNSTKTRKML